MRILLLIILIVSAPLHHALSIEVPYGEAAPDFTLKNIEGEEVSLKDFKDRIIALIYWKDDHDYSYKALDDYNTFYKIYSKKGVQFIGIAGETDDHDKISRILNALKIKFPVLPWKLWNQGLSNHTAYRQNGHTHSCHSGTSRVI